MAKKQKVKGQTIIQGKVFVGHSTKINAIKI